MQIKFVKNLKRGKLYLCEQCNISWYLLENKEWLYRIPKEYGSLIEDWDINKNDIDKSAYRVLKEIGGVADDSMDRIGFSCTLVERQGNIVDMAIVMISKSTPEGWINSELVRWSAEIKEIRISPFALPGKIRIASSEKREERVGFAPVSVKDNDSGKLFTLGAESEFFNFNRVVGKNLVLAEKPKRWQNIVWSQPAQRYYFVDWFDGCEALIIKAKDSIQPN